jgi:putative endonuclease
LAADTTIYWVYVLENARGRFYIGTSDDPERRLTEHNDSTRGHTSYTHKNGPWRLVWREPHPTRAAAVAREKQIKRKKSAQWIRDHLLNGRVPTSSGLTGGF